MNALINLSRCNRVSLWWIIGVAITLQVVIFYTTVAQSPARSSDTMVAKADTLLKNEDYEGALKIFSEILAKSKEITTAELPLLYKRAYCYYALNDFDNALRDINRYIDKVPDDQAKLLRAYINQELEDYDAQLEDLNAFIAANPGNPELLRWRASVYMESERFREAQKDLQELMTLQPGPELQAYLGLTYYYLDSPDSALVIFDQVIGSSPEYIQPYLYASSLSLEQEAYDLALDYINRGLAIDRNNLTLLFYKGIALVEKDETDDGCRCLTKAFEGGMDDVADYLKSYCYGAN